MNPYVNDFSTSVQKYYKELRKCKPITRNKEIKLFEKVRNNDNNAKQEIIKSHLKFVFQIAKKYRGQGVALEDLISEGNLGLTKAIDKFDENKGIKFISYAVWWIKQSMQECIKKNQRISTMEILEDDVVNPYNEDDLANKLTEIGDKSWEENEENEKVEEERLTLIHEMISKLPERGQYIIQSYYGFNNNKEMNLEEIGSEIGLTKERVRQIKEQCLRILRSEVLMSEKFNDLFAS